MYLPAELQFNLTVSLALFNLYYPYIVNLINRIRLLNR